MKQLLSAFVFLLACCSWLAPTSIAQTGSDGVMAFYPFNGNAHDESGNGHNGDIRGALLTTDRHGAANSAYDFDGVNDFIIASPVDMSDYNQISIQAWVRPDDVRTGYYRNFVRQQGSGRLPDFLLAFQNGGSILSFGLHTGNRYVELDVPINGADFIDGEWHHIVATYDGSRQRLYVNGLEIGSQPKTGNIDFFGNFLRIGTMGGKEYFDGKIDDVLILNRALSQAEITAMYTNDGLDEDNSALLSGRVFIDANADCRQDPGEDGFAQRLVTITPGPVYAWTDARGDYSVRLLPGEYTVKLAEREYWSQSCPDEDEGHSLKVQKGGESLPQLDFAAWAPTTVRALDVSLSGFRVRPGFTVSYTISYRNVGTVPYNGTLYFEHDHWLEFLGSVPQADAYQPDIASWSIRDLPLNGSGTITIELRLDRETPLGIEICSYTYAESENPDIELSRIGGDSFCHEVMGSYDPNDISVTPEGRIYDYERDQILSYTIRFQNTGTAPAAKVVVLDTLPFGLDLASLRLGAVSHGYEFSIDGHNVLRWTFDGIELPDSHANEAASHGYIKYKIGLRSDLAIGVPVHNSAAIYFDFNDPVITNTVETVLARHPTSVDEEMAGAIDVYPNPAGDRLTLHFEEAFNGQLFVRDLLGRTVLRRDVKQSTAAKLDVRTLPVGRYYLVLNNDKGSSVRMLNVAR